MQELEAILKTVEGVGQVKVYVNYEETEADNGLLTSYFQSNTLSNTISGVLVVAEGANNEGVKLSLTTTLSRVLQVAPHRIVIMPMTTKEEIK